MRRGKPTPPIPWVKPCCRRRRETIIISAPPRAPAAPPSPTWPTTGGEDRDRRHGDLDRLCHCHHDVGRRPRPTRSGKSYSRPPRTRRYFLSMHYRGHQRRHRADLADDGRRYRTDGTVTWTALAGPTGCSSPSRSPMPPVAGPPARRSIIAYRATGQYPDDFSGFTPVGSYRASHQSPCRIPAGHG